MNTKEHPSLATRFGIRSIPTLALFHLGRELARQASAMGTADMVRWARQDGGLSYAFDVERQDPV